MSLPKGMKPFDWKHWKCAIETCPQVRQTCLMEVIWEDHSEVRGSHNPPDCGECGMRMVPCTEGEFLARLTPQ